MEQKKINKILTILLIMQWAFIQIIAQYPNFVEKYYSNGIYPIISTILRSLLGWLPFSLGDLIYAFAIYFIVVSIYKSIKTREFNFKNLFFKLGAIFSVIFFLFHFNWGLNYFREPLYERLQFKKTTYTNQELIEFTNKLIVKVNSAQVIITNNDTIMVKNPSTKKEIKNLAALAYQDLNKKDSSYIYIPPSIKHSLFSAPLTYMGFAGYINPITNEAQINSLIPKNSYAATVCHEIAHQTGIGSEKEANFIGYLAAINSKDKYFNYSGYIMALKYCLGDVYRRDEMKFEELKNKLNKGVLKDLKQSQEFWQSYQNWSEKFFKIFYDSYLKANKQDDGIKGYNQVVLLLINYYLSEEL